MGIPGTRVLTKGFEGSPVKYTLHQTIINIQMNLISATACYKAFKLSIWHSLSNWIAIPWGVERTMLPVQPFKLFTPLNFLMLSLGMVKSRINRVPSGKDLSVVMNIPEADISLVSKSKTSFLPNVMVSSLTGSGIVNLSYWRFSFIDNAFLCHQLWTNLWGRSYWTYLNSSWFFAEPRKWTQTTPTLYFWIGGPHWYGYKHNCPVSGDVHCPLHLSPFLCLILSLGTSYNAFVKHKVWNF